MRRVLIRSLGVAVFTWLEFVVFPGHTYLQSGTQLSVPMIERLANPGFLSRDLVATHPNLQYTAYDEATLFLHEVTGMSIEKALLTQQIACRAAGLLGIVLLALSAGMSEPLALLIAASVNLGGNLAGPHVMLVESEAVPGALAWGLILLTMGLLARGKPLLAGLAGGLALIYAPALAAPLWLLSLLALIVDARVRRLLRPAMTVLAIFILLLANLAQLQPGIVEQQTFFGKISADYAELQQFRTPYEWVSLWSAGEFWSYLAVWVCGIWAVVRIWPVLNRQVRWLLVGLPIWGLLSVPVSYLLLDRLRWSFIASIQPTEWLLFTLCLSSVSCWMAGAKAAQSKRVYESALWFFIPFAVPLRAEVLDLLHINRVDAVERFGLAILLALVASLLIRTVKTNLRVIVLAIPLLAIALLRLPVFANTAGAKQQGAVIALAEWVKRNTWGSSMFLFPDLGLSGDPGLFRARSERAVWVDWNSGLLVPCFQSFAAVWWDRWQQTMQAGYSPQRLQADLSLPIDYYVITRPNRIADIKPVFTNEKFLVYDANDLRNVSGSLRSAHTN